jgi:hypothetical protein
MLFPEQSVREGGVVSAPASVDTDAAAGRAEGRSRSAFFSFPQSARGGRLRRNGGPRGLKGWGLTRAGHERYVSLQAKLRSATDTPAGKSGLECSHNIRLLSEDTPLLSQESPFVWAFFLFLSLLSRLGRTAGSRKLGLVWPTHLRFGDDLKSRQAPRFWRNPQAVLCRTGQGKAIHTESWLKHIEHLTASLPKSGHAAMLRIP